MQNNQNGAPYTEKEVLADALTMQKNITGTLNNFSNECKNQNVRKTMLEILNDEHSIQFDVFNDMHTRGYYKTTPAQQDKINQVKSTYAQQANNTGTSANTGEWHTKQDDPLRPQSKM
ncbi:spore coat protein [Christensenellaceae bacterium OttesenSCG-928-M15]|nr:spore coat protein [Christensenellaceae bacterium OttesenSCG-928-M15]